MTNDEMVTEQNVVSSRILKESFKDVCKAFEKLAKKAEKFGCPAPSFRVTGEAYQYLYSHYEGADEVRVWYDDKVPASDMIHKFTGQIREIMLVDVTVYTVKMAGWSFVATLDFDLSNGMGNKNDVIVRKAPGTEKFDLSAFRSKEKWCDHCKTFRQRKDTYVVGHEDGRLAQVGSSCIKDFLGHDALKALGSMQVMEAAIDECQISSGSSGSGASAYDLEMFLAQTIVEIRENGWVSRTQAREDVLGRLTATADCVLATLSKRA